MEERHIQFEREMCEFMDSIGAVATVSDRMIFQWTWNGMNMKACVHVDDVLYNGTSDRLTSSFDWRTIILESVREEV